MSIDKMDQYIKGLYANESVPPPPGAEDALFERMANTRTRSRFGKISGSIALVCLAFWFGAPLMEQSNDIQSMDDFSTSNPFEEAAAPDTPHQGAFTPAVEVGVVLECEEERLQNAEVSPAAEEDQKATVAVSREAIQTTEQSVRSSNHQSTVTTMESLPIPSIEKNSNKKELLEAEEETWVLPAVVKVKD